MPAQHQLDKLQLPPDLHGSYKVLVPKGDDEKVLSGLSQINLFVGSNNSGKSRLLRRLLKNPKPLLLPRNYPEGPRLASLYIKEKISHFRLGFLGAENIRPRAAKIPSYDLFNEGAQEFSELKDFIAFLKQGGVSWGAENFKLVCDLDEFCAKHLNGITEAESYVPEMQRLYIPTLRSLRPTTIVKAEAPSIYPLSHDERFPAFDAYRQRTLFDYFKEGSKINDPGPIFTGLSFYDDFRALLLGGHAERKAARDFEKFLSTELFEGASVTLIPHIDSDVVHIKIGSERDKAVHDLGDGIQQLIILTFPLFRNRDKPTLVFIEEPELFLHPGMQRSLLKAMLGFENYQYFISTHSNHLLDLTLEFEDISIYMVRKDVKDKVAEETDAHFEIEPASTHDHRLLEMLGARVSSVFLSNCTVWVEGVTDRLYLGHGLKLYQEHLKAVAEEKGEPIPAVMRQDFHFSFVEYSGGNVTHWAFDEPTKDLIEVKKLCGRVMLIADLDGGAKAGRHEELKAALDDRFLVLPSREIENLLTPEVLQKVLVDYGEDEADIQPLKPKEYKTQYLGTYLDSKIRTRKREGSYAAGSGTVSAKTAFCTKAIKHQTTFGDLSPDAQCVVIDIYNFIKKHNQ